MASALTPITQGNQLRAVSGREGRQTQAAIARALSPIAISRAQYEQESENMRLAESAQRRQQTQQGVANAIGGIGTLAQAGELAKDLGLFGTTAAPATAPAVTSAGVGAGTGASIAASGAAETAGGIGTTAGTAGGSIGAGGTAAGTGGSVATGAAGSTIGAGVAGVGAGVTGATIGQTVRQADLGKTANQAIGFGIAGPAIFALDSGTQKRLSGAAAGATSGAALGAATGGVVGAAIGFVIGGVGGGLCITISCCHGPESEEVQVARAYRDSKMTKQQIRAYYFLSESLVPKMESDPAYKESIRHHLVDPLIRYGRYVLGMPLNAPPPSPDDTRVAQAFLTFLSMLGEGMPPVTRSNGEVM